MKTTAAELRKSWLKTIREHIRQESTCVGPKAVADRYLKLLNGEFA